MHSILKAVAEEESCKVHTFLNEIEYHTKPFVRRSTLRSSLTSNLKPHIVTNIGLSRSEFFKTSIRKQLQKSLQSKPRDPQPRSQNKSLCLSKADTFFLVGLYF